MKHLILKSIIACSLIFVLKNANAQYYYYNNNYYDKDLIWEIGGSFGSMHAYTDVGRKQFTFFLPSNIDFKSTKTNTSIYLGFLYQDVIGMRLEATFGNVANNDANGSYPWRNTSFRSSISEFAVITEFHPFNLNYLKPVPRLSPYLNGGIGIFSFNPQTNYKGKWIDLQPLSTEGQGFKEYPNSKPYKLQSISIPFGGGLKYEVSPIITVRAEALARYTLTDYLDDAKQESINPDVYDLYFNEQKAQLAAALTNRTKEYDPNSNYDLIYKGGNRFNDFFLSFNLKFGLTLGRERIR